MSYTSQLTTDENGVPIYPITDDILRKLVNKNLWVKVYSEDYDDVEYKWYIHISEVFMDGDIKFDSVPAYSVDTDFTNEYPEDIIDSLLPVESVQWGDVQPLDIFKIYLPMELYTEDEIFEISESNLEDVGRILDDGDDEDVDGDDYY